MNNEQEMRSAFEAFMREFINPDSEMRYMPNDLIEGADALKVYLASKEKP